MGHKHQVHYGLDNAIHAARQHTLNAAFKRNPERFVRKEPQPPAKPIEPWINPPQKKLNIQA
jgi:hypothetical protein